MLDSTRLLFALAEQFESQQAYAQAIKCLTPICSQGSEELPTVVAQARLRVASLLLAHFDNFKEAKSLLLTAVRQLLPAAANGSAPLPPPPATRLSCLSSLRLPCMTPCCAAGGPLLQEQELRQTQGNHLLKCEVWDCLALCNRKLGAVAAELEALTSGVKACRHGANSKDK